MYILSCQTFFLTWALPNRSALHSNENREHFLPQVCEAEPVESEAVAKDVTEKAAYMPFPPALPGCRGHVGSLPNSAPEHFFPISFTSDHISSYCFALSDPPVSERELGTVPAQV